MASVQKSIQLTAVETQKEREQIARDTEQYIGTERLGNNYAPMPGTYWYNPEGQHGQFNIKVRHQCEARAFGADGNPVEKQQTY